MLGGRQWLAGCCSLLLAALAACATSTSARPAGKSTVMEQPTELGPQDYIFRYTAQAGPELGPGLRERDRQLVVQSREQLARLEQHRAAADKAGVAIGRFSLPLDAQALSRIESFLKSDAFQTLPAGNQADISATFFTLTYETAKASLQKRLSSRDIPQIQQLQPLLGEVNRIQSELRKRPEAALALRIRHLTQGGKDLFQLAFANVGRQMIAIGDPRWLDRQPDNWAGVRIATYPPEVPGVTALPPEWSPLHLARPAGPRPATPSDLVIPAGREVLAVTEAWQPEKRGVRYLVQGVLVNYRGPAEGDPYRVRGAVFSEGLEITPP